MAIAAPCRPQRSELLPVSVIASPQERARRSAGRIVRGRPVRSGYPRPLLVAFRLSLRTEVPRRNHHSKRYPLRALFDSAGQLAHNVSAYRRFRLEMLRLNAHNLPERTRNQERRIDINTLCLHSAALSLAQLPLARFAIRKAPHHRRAASQRRDLAAGAIVSLRPTAFRSLNEGRGISPGDTTWRPSRTWGA